MAILATVASIASALAGVAGTIISASGQMQAGKAAKDAEFFKAQQLQQRAQEERASAQREAFKQRRETNLAQSRLQALSASDGGSADDPTVLNLAEGIEKEGEHQALMEFYKGENRARGLEDEATGAIMTGKAKAQGARYSAMGTIASGASSLLDRFGSKDSILRKNYG